MVPEIRPATGLIVNPGGKLTALKLGAPVSALICRETTAPSLLPWLGGMLTGANRVTPGDSVMGMDTAAAGTPSGLVRPMARVPSMVRREAGTVIDTWPPAKLLAG